ncbi:MAG: 6-bladed beta-propeller [Tannerella sp.]|jgi:hypothetical protein|nr:6-bladed beta-propeller [Tannerella sp.]
MEKWSKLILKENVVLPDGRDMMTALKSVVRTCLLLFFIPLSYSLHGQRTVRINASETTAVKLSEIARDAVPIAMEKLPSGVQNVFIAGEYVFLQSISSVLQYDLTGKFIRNIPCKGYARGISGDTVKREIYVPAGVTEDDNKIYCYDYSGKLKRTYRLKGLATGCLFDKGMLWILYARFHDDKTTGLYMSGIDLQTGSDTGILYERRYGPDLYNGGLRCPASSSGQLTLHNQTVIASFGYDSVIYRINEQKTVPFVAREISIPAKTLVETRSLYAHGCIGKYLFVNYRRGEQFYVYLEDMKSKKGYNTKYEEAIADDIFHTGYLKTVHPVNGREGYFYIFKERGEIAANTVGNIPLKDGPVLFIVKTKQ